MWLTSPRTSSWQAIVLPPSTPRSRIPIFCRSANCMRNKYTNHMNLRCIKSRLDLLGNCWLALRQLPKYFSLMRSNLLRSWPIMMSMALCSIRLWLLLLPTATRPWTGSWGLANWIKSQLLCSDKCRTTRSRRIKRLNIIFLTSFVCSQL